MTGIKTGFTPVLAPITPGSDDTNTWATHYAKYGAGGFETVNAVSDLANISDDRKVDKTVLVRKGASGKPELYEWNGTKWAEVDLSSPGVLFYEGRDVYGGIKKIQLRNFYMLPSRVEKDQLTLEPLTSYLDMHTLKIDASTVRVHPPLKVSQNTDFDRAVNLELDPDFTKGINDKFDGYEKIHSDGYLAYSDAPIVLRSFDGKEDPASYIFFKDVRMALTNKNIATDESAKTITLKAFGPKVSPYYIGFQLYSSSVAQKDGQVTVSVVSDAKDSPAITDLNGDPVAETLHLKQGEAVGRIYLDAVIKADKDRAIKFKVQSTCGELILNTTANGVTGMIVSQLDHRDLLGPDIRQWSLDTGENPYVIAYSFEGNFATTPSIDALKAEGFTDGKQFPANYQIHNTDSLTIWSEDAFTTEIDGDELHIKGTTFFTYGVVIDSDRTRLMRGKRYYMTFEGSPKTSDVKLMAAFWNGAPDNLSYPAVLDIKKDDKPNLDKGFKTYTDYTVTQISDGSYTKKTVEFGVPNDAENIALLVMPMGKTPCDIGIKSVYMTARNGDPKDFLILSDDKFAEIPLSQFERVLPIDNTAIKKCKGVSQTKITIDVPVAGFMDVRALKVSSSGVVSSVSGLSHSYDPSTKELTVNFGSAGDYVLAVTLFS